MEREELKGRQTPGKWEERGGFIAPLDSDGDPIVIAGMLRHRKGRGAVNDAPFAGYQDGYTYATAEQSKANAALIAEAGTVANRTGMWPADMEERIKKLEEASNRVMEAVGAVNQYRKEKNNPNLPKPLNSDMQTMWKELQDANNALAKTLRPHLFDTPSTIN